MQICRRSAGVSRDFRPRFLLIASSVALYLFFLKGGDAASAVEETPKQRRHFGRERERVAPPQWQTTRAARRGCNEVRLAAGTAQSYKKATKHHKCCSCDL